MKKYVLPIMLGISLCNATFTMEERNSADGKDKTQNNVQHNQSAEIENIKNRIDQLIVEYRYKDDLLDFFKALLNTFLDPIFEDGANSQLRNELVDHIKLQQAMIWPYSASQGELDSSLQEIIIKSKADDSGGLDDLVVLSEITDLIIRGANPNIKIGMEFLLNHLVNYLVKYAADYIDQFDSSKIHLILCIIIYGGKYYFTKFGNHDLDGLFMQLNDHPRGSDLIKLFKAFDALETEKQIYLIQDQDGNLIDVSDQMAKLLISREK